MRWVRPVIALGGLLVLAGCSLPTDILGGAAEQPLEPPPHAAAAESPADQAALLRTAEDEVAAARQRGTGTEADQLALATSLVTLALTRRAGGDHAGAAPLYIEVLSIRERVLGAAHPDVATTLNSLAAVYVARDDYAAAEPLLRRALAIREAALGAGERLTAQSLNNLALLYAAQARFDAAEPLYQRAIAAFEGKHASDLVIALENYAALLDDAGRTDEARQVETRVRTLRAATDTGAAVAGAPTDDASEATR